MVVVYVEYNVYLFLKELNEYLSKLSFPLRLVTTFKSVHLFQRVSVALLRPMRASPLDHVVIVSASGRQD